MQKFMDFLSFAFIPAMATGLIVFSFAESVDAQSVGGVAPSFSFATSTSAARVQGSGAEKYYKEIRCWNNSATVVYIGDQNSQDYPICTDTASCPEAALSVATANLFAKSAAGTPSLVCVTLR